MIIHVISSCDGKAELSASLLQSSVSHDPSKNNTIEISDSVCYRCRIKMTAFI